MDDPFVVFKKLLKEYLYEETIPLLEAAWHEPHRKYHNINHLKEVIDYLSYQRIHPMDVDTVMLAAFFHDCYYNPRDHRNNEDESIKRFLSSYKNKNFAVKHAVVALIEVTKYRKRPDQYLTRMFWDADNASFYKGYDKLLKNELLIRKEFSHMPKKIYKEKRIEFLKTNIGLFDVRVDKAVNKLIAYVNDAY